MTHLRSVLCTLFAMFTFSGAAMAQLPLGPPAPTSLVGSNEYLNPDGTPLSPGNSITLDVSIQAGVMLGVVKLNGVANPTENITYELIGTDPLLYVWTNLKGNSGMTGWNPATQQFEDIIITGPLAGSVAILCPR